MEVAQRQRTVDAEQGEAHAPQRRSEQRSGVGGLRRERRLVRAGRASGPARGNLRPEPLVHSESLLVGRVLSPHPVGRLPVEGVKRVDGALAPPLEHVSIDPGEPDGQPGAGVGVVVEPSWRRWKGAVGSWVAGCRRGRRPERRCHRISWEEEEVVVVGRHPATPTRPAVCPRGASQSPGPPHTPAPRPANRRRIASRGAPAWVGGGGGVRRLASRLSLGGRRSPRILELPRPIRSHTPLTRDRRLLRVGSQTEACACAFAVR